MTTQSMVNQLENLTNILIEGGSISDGARLYGSDDVQGLIDEHDFSQWEAAHTIAQSVYLIRTNDGRAMS